MRGTHDDEHLLICVGVYEPSLDFMYVCTASNRLVSKCTTPKTRILMDDRLALAPSHTITFVSKPYRCNMNIVSYKVERMNLAFILSELV